MKKAPAAFKDYNYKQYYRTVKLTKLACQRLQEQNEKITKSNVYRISREFDEKGMGIHPNSIRGNDKALSIFLQYSQETQPRQRRGSKSKQIPAAPQPNSEIPLRYKNREVSDLVGEIEQLTQVVEQLKKENEILKKKYEKVRKLKDEILQQNALQLAQLTSIRSTGGAQRNPTEPPH